VIITEISSQKNKQDRFNIYIDGEFFAGISSLTLAKENLYKGLEIEEERLNNILLLELENRIFDRVVNNISNTPKTEFQIKRYIKDLIYKKRGKWFSKDFPIEEEDLISKIVTKLLEYKFLDDEAYARMFVQSRIRNKPRGKFVLIRELVKKGIKKDIAIKVCDELIDDEYDILKKTYQKKYKDENITMDDSKKIQYLQRKGFNWDLIKKYIDDDTRE
jgi:regulatory protein